MSAVRAPQGLDAGDRVALGLDSTHLFYLVILSMSGWAVLGSGLPAILRVPLGGSLLTAAVALAWGSYAGRPLDRWLQLYVCFRLRTLAATAGDRAEAVGSPRPLSAAVPALAPTPCAPAPPPASASAPTRRARRAAFYSENGGSGKSTLAVEVAALAAARGVARVAVIDVAPRAAALRFRLGLDSGTSPATASQAASNATLESQLLRHPAGFRVFTAACVDGVEHVTRLGAVLAYLDTQLYDLVLFDIPTGSATNAQELMRAADIVFAVFTATPGGVAGVYRAIADLRALGLRTQLRMVLNRVGHSVVMDEVLGDLRVPLCARVPQLPAIMAAEAAHDCAATRDRATAGAIEPLLEAALPLSALELRRPLDVAQLLAAAP